MPDVKKLPFNQAPPMPRVTVIETITYRAPFKDAQAIDTRWTAPLNGDEQPWVRMITVGSEWTPLDFGWLKEVGLLIIKNEHKLEKTLTKPEENAIAPFSITYGMRLEETLPLPLAIAEIAAGQSLRIVPLSVKSLGLQSFRGEQVPCTVYAFPR